MFDVEVGGVTYRESEVEAPGEEIVVADTGSLELGLSVCYDLRFPELFRIMAVDGAQAFSLPAAFTVPTGRAHWEILIRARAIENQAFVIAAGQVGRHPPDHESYGHSMIVDAWGTVLAAAAEQAEHVVTADLDLDAQRDVRAKLPSLANRRPAAYRRREEALR
jgi:predicted amidohydrolase